MNIRGNGKVILVDNTRPTIVYVLGPAYTGSTLFGLAVGQQDGILNLGEVINLENDFSPKVKCSCGNCLSDCDLWSRITTDISEVQSSEPDAVRWNFTHLAKRELIDEKGNYLKKLKLTLGCSCRAVYGQREFDRYATKNASFFHAMQRCVPDAKAIVDLSKAPERLEALLSRDDLDVRAVLLKRSPLAVYASSMKRPKRTRQHIGPKVLREAALQYLRFQHCVRIFETVPPEKRLVVSFERFIDDPVGVLDVVTRWMGTSVTHAPLEDGRLFVSTSTTCLCGQSMALQRLPREGCSKIKRRHVKTEPLPKKGFKFCLSNGQP